MSFLPVPLSVCTDSYKAGHFAQYPDAQKMIAYGEFRANFQRDATDSRFIFFGMRYFLENFLFKQWTLEDVEKADKFYSTHNAGNNPYPYPKELFEKFVKENNGYFPVKIEALRDGQVANIHTPVYQITTVDEYAKLVTFLETMLTMVWYPSTVATLSRRTRDLVEASFERTCDEDVNWMIDFKLHDFGFRGCTSLEQSILGGLGHLINFRGSDTMSACYYAQFELNEGKPVAQSIPATEHSVMTSWESEIGAIRNMITKFGGEGSVFAIVMDSYDYTNALDNILPIILKQKTEKGGVMVLRPDSGDPVEVIVQALKAADKVAGHVVNSKGYKVINGFNAIQGDGINYYTIIDILKAVEGEGYSAQNVAFGMGGGLLQKVNRDTMSFATKLSFIQYADGKIRNVMKKPKTEGGKKSFPGPLKVIADENGIPNIYPRAHDEENIEGNLLEVVYDYGPVKDYKFETFDQVRERAASGWKKTPKTHNPISKELDQAVTDWIADFKAGWEKRNADQ
eukprot:TRINITY_DN743_c0_g2_i1.p1 TRINITY_DN743_c0_g2~~TRINITY_DN743_c0_g2_i1.p1  ORF type:complete len:532 (+),score=178.28 TRINITY_DN743_c0_g2_i1:62-1597(+)